MNNDDRNINGHGGARQGAGRKPKGYVKPVAIAAYEESHARLEQAKADLAQLKLTETIALYVDREAVAEAMGQAYACIDEALRPLAARMQHSLGLGPDVAAEVSTLVDAALRELRRSMTLTS